MNSEGWIEHLGLQPHPEGGYYKEVYRNPATIQVLSSGGKRNLATSIYFLLKEDQKSHFHQLASDELWYFHAGTSLTVHIFEGSCYRKEFLGLDVESGETPQLLLPAGSIFAAQVSDQKSYTLIGCVVNPGFDFKDFRMVESSELIRQFPKHVNLIRDFTLS